MNKQKHLILTFTTTFLLFLTSFCSNNKERKSSDQENAISNFQIGWSMVSITPDKPVFLSGHWRARISEKINDTIFATALALEKGNGPDSEKVIMISCDLLDIHDGVRDQAPYNLRDLVRQRVVNSIPELKFDQIIINAIHTHTAPLISTAQDSETHYGINLNAASPAEILEFISVRIAQAAEQAWQNRKPGGISYGLSFAVVAHNRLVTYFSGQSVMEGKTNLPDFSHIEGFEDHSINLIYTWDTNKKLSGVIINIAADCQATGGESFISADYWHETRMEVRKRLGKEVFVLPQVSSAGDQGINVQVGAKAERRMQEMMISVPDSIEKRLQYYMGWRQMIANRIADAVTSILPYMEEHIEWDPAFEHRMVKAELTRRVITDTELNNALKTADEFKNKYEALLIDINKNPSIKEKSRWFNDITTFYSRMMFFKRAKERYDMQKTRPKIPVELHIIRLSDVAIATNPFELYLDYGMRIKGRSPATQTFIVQLAGSGTYLPTVRSIAGGAYGGIPGSNLVGPEGGQELVEITLETINSLWKEE